MIDRFRAGFQTELGTIFLFLAGILVCLGLAYLLLLLYQKKKDRLRYQYHSYYEQAEKLLTAYTLVGKSVADIFGRETVISSSEGQKALCLIPPPPIVDESVKQRFEEYTRSIATVNLSMLASYSWTSTQNAWIVIQENLLHPDGRKLLTLDKCIKDDRLSGADKEQVLINLAKCLSTLHQCRTDSGEALFHGFLLPRSIYIDLDKCNEIKQIIIAYHGLAFSIGSEKFQKQLDDLKKGNLIIDKWIVNDLVSKIKNLAPEQLSHKRIHEVGPSSDFYTFATLALMTFGGNSIPDIETFDWKVIPENWHHFLKSCLSDDIKKRPKDFNELEEWLADPEMGLTIHGSEVSLKDYHNTSKESEEEFLHSVGSLDIQAVQSIGRQQQKKQSTANFSEHYSAGMKAFSSGKWQVANNHFLQAIDLDKENLEAHINLAITYYEIGEMEDAEKYYKHVKNINPQLAKTFRKHIAFRM
jgi:tetratricopeptide (TPR) repeat protein